MQSFHVILHRAPLGSSPTEAVTTDAMAEADVRLGDLSEPLPTTFEEAIDDLQAMPRMFIEPDGSFVWVAAAESDAWQVDGQLHDGAGQLATVEIKGQLPAEDWCQLIQCFGSERVALVVQFVREGRFLTESEFRTQWLGGES